MTTIQDGTVKWQVVTKTNKEYVDDLVATKEKELTMTLQTGTVSYSGNGWFDTNVTFPKAFSSVPLVSVVNITKISTENHMITNITTTGMKISQYCTDPSFTYSVYWQALGYINE